MFTPAEQLLISRDFNTALQQKGSKFRPCCTVQFFSEGVKAEQFKEVGTTEAEWADTSGDDTPDMGATITPRFVKPRKFHWGALFDEEDIKKGIGDPTSAFIQSGAYAMGRFLDRQVIIPRLFDYAWTGVDGGTQTVFPADGSQDIAVTIGSSTGAANTSMNVNKFIDALTLLEGNDVDTDAEEIFCAMSYLEKRALMKDTKFVSRDYRDAAVYDNVTGKLKSFLGVTILIANGLTVAAGKRACPFWTKSGFGLGIWLDENLKMGEDPAKQFKVRVYKRLYGGGNRLNEKKAVRVYATSDGTVA